MAPPPCVAHPVGSDPVSDPCCPREPPQPASPLPAQCRRSPLPSLECFECLSDDEDDELELPTNMFIEEHKHEESVLTWVMDLLDPRHGMDHTFVDIHMPLDCPTLFSYDPWKVSVDTNALFMSHILRVAGVPAKTIMAYLHGILGDSKTIAAHAAMIRGHFMQGKKVVLHTWVQHYTS